MTAETLTAVLALPGCRDVIEDVIAVSGHGGPQPAMVRLIEQRLPGVVPDQRSLIMELAAGTARARRLGKAHPGWLYTNRMAEQCTHPAIAEVHASRYSECRFVVEICTGAGHDTLALSRRCERVVSYEADPLVAMLTRSNLTLAGVQHVRVHAEAWTPTATPPPEMDGVWADPSRRSTSGHRSRSGADHDPPLDAIIHWVKGASQDVLLGIKLGPGDVVSDPLEQVAACEFIGFGRECRERVLWLGGTRSSDHHHTVHLVDRHAVWQPSAPRMASTPLDVSKARYLIEPHAAMIAAGLVTEYFAEVGVSALDPLIAYGLSALEPVESPFHERFRIELVDHGIDRKKIRRRLRELEWGRDTEFKKRGWDGHPEELRALLPQTATSAGGVVLLARAGSGHLTIYAHRLGRNESRPMGSIGR